MKQLVLFVDDDRNLLESIKRQLRGEPYEVLTATSGNEALSIMSAFKIDLIISDQEMPLMSGTELLALTKRRCPSTIRMMLSGRSTFSTALEAINECAVHTFLTKPADPFQLALSVREALSSRASEAAHLARQENLKQRIALAVLERSTPGISTLRRTEDGAIVIEED